MQNKMTSQPTESSMLADGAASAKVDSGQNIDDEKPMEEEYLEENAFKEKAIRVAKDAVFEQKKKLVHLMMSV